MNCNIAFLGDVGVGKTAIICRMLTSKVLVLQMVPVTVPNGLRTFSSSSIIRVRNIGYEFLYQLLTELYT